MNSQRLNPKMKIVAFVVSCSILVFGFEPAIADTDRTTRLDTVEFDLARDCPPAHGDSELSGKVAAETGGPRIDWRKTIHGLSAKEKYKPYWAYRLRAPGPNIEIAALGAGNKTYPRVAHVAMDWQF